jgi:hypothetical protein
VAPALPKKKQSGDRETGKEDYNGVIVRSMVAPFLRRHSAASAGGVRTRHEIAGEAAINSLSGALSAQKR